MRIAVGSDERTDLTDFVIDELRRRGHEVEPFGPLAGEDLEWAEVGRRAAEAVARGRCDEGILFCWTGTGVCIVANKVPGIRAALCVDAETARGARRWNHANVLVMSLRLTSIPVAREILDAWFSTPYGTDEFDLRNIRRLEEVERVYRSPGG
ncbi:MAG: RpiB/LacA/LacB family sugar-phosphate isomerase [Caldiserica bacterium]|nr:RpiB/LacA/LacB family sugar-phosphate isomerase [Caldisericota bacterium]